jgi:KaiC/GvpD/RAD55 family RecA-like ATPase
VDGLERVFIVRENESNPKPGETFVAGCRKRLAELDFKGNVFEIKMPDGAKDPGALWQRDPASFSAKLTAALEAAERPPRPPYLTVSEMVVSALKPVGQRLSTSFETLDEATRGGIPLGRVLVLAGAPGAAKTTLSTFLIAQWEKAGCAVVYLAADEPAEGILTRLGQLHGFSREALESEGPAGEAIRAGFAERASGHAMAVIEPDADDSMCTIEDAERALLHLAGVKPRVLVVDSLQTARCAGAELAESARERIDAKIAVIKAIAKRGTLVVAISEMSRAGYPSGSRAENISALASGKESGSIEYGAALLLGLRSVANENGLIDVEVAKNRLGGSKPEFRLKLDFDRASFEEVDLPSEATSAHATEEAKASRDRDRILTIVASRRDLRSASAVSRTAGGNKQDNLAMVRELTEEGLLVKVDGCFRVAAQARQVDER